MNALQKFLGKQVNIIEKEKFNSVNNDRWRLNFHLMPPVGWLNDPNGLCFFNNEYHVFFQYSPFDAEGGLKFWGHYKSSDLLNWNYMGVPLLPDQPFDCHGAYSGSALVENNKIYLFYTGNVKYDGDYNYVTNGRGSNTIYSELKDGKNAENKRCILTNMDYPDDLTCHVRDPKIWKEYESYYIVLGARNNKDKGIVLVYESKNKLDWKLINRIESEKTFGYMWECPDLFRLENQTVLSISPQGIKEKLRPYQNIYQSGYFYLNGDFKSNYNLSDFYEWDMGFDFYAPQTFTDKYNRRIMYGWMGMPDCEDEYINPTKNTGWQHAFTIARELVFKEGKIFQKPIKEMENLRDNKIILKNNCMIEKLESYEIIIENNNNNICIEIENDLKLIYDKNNFYMEFKSPIGAGRKKRCAEIKNCINIRIFIDISSVEVFLNGGEMVFTTRFYPYNGKSSAKILCSEEININLWKLNKLNISYNI